MADTLNQIIDSGSGIPEIGTRITALVIVTFVLVFLWVLLFVKMKEADKSTNAKAD